MKQWYRIELSYATFGILVDDDVVIETAPIGKWMRWMNLKSVEAWVKSKKGTIAPLVQ